MYKKQNTNLSVLSGYITARRECMREICHSCPGLLDGGGRGANKMKRHQMREIREWKSTEPVRGWPLALYLTGRTAVSPALSILSSLTDNTKLFHLHCLCKLYPSVSFCWHNLTWGRYQAGKKMYSLYWHEGTIKIVFVHKYEPTSLYWATYSYLNDPMNSCMFCQKEIA